VFEPPLFGIISEHSKNNNRVLIYLIVIKPVAADLTSSYTILQIFPLALFPLKAGFLLKRTAPVTYPAVRDY
jgi:hypothetical protein